MSKWFVIKFWSGSWNSFDTGFTNSQLSSFIWISNNLWQQVRSKTEPKSRNHFFYWFSFCTLVKEFHEIKEVMYRSTSLCFITFGKGVKQWSSHFNHINLALGLQELAVFSLGSLTYKSHVFFPFWFAVLRRNFLRCKRFSMSLKSTWLLFLYDFRKLSSMNTAKKQQSALKMLLIFSFYKWFELALQCVIHFLNWEYYIFVNSNFKKKKIWGI